MKNFVDAIKSKQVIYQAKEIDKKQKLDKEQNQLIKLLKAAYCDEWLAVYQYSIESDFLNKLNYQNQISDKVYNQITKELDIHTFEEFNHAKILVPELIFLKSQPEYQIDMLQLSANGPLLIPEKDETNILNQAIQAEESAIKVYTEISKFLKDTKICSEKFQDSIKYILDQEYEHRDDLNKLLTNFKLK